MGKFTQSVRRIVQGNFNLNFSTLTVIWENFIKIYFQDVKDEGTMSGMSREEVIETNERLRMFRIRLDESYDTAKKALNMLMAKYGDSKSQRNIFHRYPLLKIMIKVSNGTLLIIFVLILGSTSKIYLFETHIFVKLMGKIIMWSQMKESIFSFRSWSQKKNTSSSVSFPILSFLFFYMTYFHRK